MLQYLPNELIRNVFSYIDRSKVYELAFLCTQFREAVHDMAVRWIKIRLKKNNVSPSQMKRFGFLESEDFSKHTGYSCPCIDIVYRYKPFGCLESETEEEQMMIHPLSQNKSDEDDYRQQFRFDFTVIEDLVAVWNEEEKDRVSLYPRYPNINQVSKSFTEKEITLNSSCISVHLYSNSKMLVLLSQISLQSRFDETRFEVRIIDVNSSGNDSCLNFYDSIPEPPRARERYVVSDIALTEDTLAIRLFADDDAESKDYILFYKIHSENSLTRVIFHSYLAVSPKLEIGSTAYRGSGFICLNDRYLVIQYLSNESPFKLDTALLIYDRRKIDSSNYFPERFEYKFTFRAELRMRFKEDSLFIEPGSSRYLVSFEPYTPSFYLIDLSSRQSLVNLRFTSVSFIPCNWFCGVFLFLQVIRTDVDHKASELICRILDPESMIRSTPTFTEQRRVTDWSTPLLSADLLEDGWKVQSTPFNFEKDNCFQEVDGLSSNSLLVGRTNSTREPVRFLFPGDKKRICIELESNIEESSDSDIESNSSDIEEKKVSDFGLVVSVKSASSKAYGDVSGIVATSCKRLLCSTLS